MQSIHDPITIENLRMHRMERSIEFSVSFCDVTHDDTEGPEFGGWISFKKATSPHKKIDRKICVEVHHPYSQDISSDELDYSVLFPSACGFETDCYENPEWPAPWEKNEYIYYSRFWVDEIDWRAIVGIMKKVSSGKIKIEEPESDCTCCKRQEACFDWQSRIMRPRYDFECEIEAIEEENYVEEMLKQSDKELAEEYESWDFEKEEPDYEALFQEYEFLMSGEQIIEELLAEREKESFV